MTLVAESEKLAIEVRAKLAEKKEDTEKGNQEPE